MWLFGKGGEGRERGGKGAEGLDGRRGESGEGKGRKGKEEGGGDGVARGWQGDGFWGWGKEVGV